MISALPLQETISKTTTNYLYELKEAGFSGDIDTRYSTRITMATDNSVYQQLPQSCLFPKDQRDIQLLTRIANKEAFRAICFGARGGGTGTNGQSLTPGINHIISTALSQSQ